MDESGIRVIVCGDNCCCRHVPVSEPVTRIPSTSEAGTVREVATQASPVLAVDTPLEHYVNRILPRSGIPVVGYFVVVFGLFNLAPHLTVRAELAVNGLAALAGGTWCVVNFWRCRRAHCVVSGAGWLGLSVLIFVEAWLGHSLIGGHEELVFLGVLVVAFAFEGAWYLARHTNSVIATSDKVR